MTDEAKALLVDIWWEEPMRFAAIPIAAWPAYAELCQSGVLAPFTTGGSGRRGIRVNIRGRKLAEELAVMDDFNGGWQWMSERYERS
jgi:hypothetical protein